MACLDLRWLDAPGFALTSCRPFCFQPDQRDRPNQLFLQRCAGRIRQQSLHSCGRRVPECRPRIDAGSAERHPAIDVQRSTAERQATWGSSPNAVGAAPLGTPFFDSSLGVQLFAGGVSGSGCAGRRQPGTARRLAALERCRKPVDRLRALLSDCESAERELETHRRRHLEELGKWLAGSGSPDRRPPEPQELLGAERRLGHPTARRRRGQARRRTRFFRPDPCGSLSRARGDPMAGQCASEEIPHVHPNRSILAKKARRAGSLTSQCERTTVSTVGGWASRIILRPFLVLAINL